VQLSEFSKNCQFQFLKYFRISPFKEQKNWNQKIVDLGYFKNLKRPCGFHERTGSWPVI
jgi:hypothetical protein